MTCRTLIRGTGAALLLSAALLVAPPVARAADEAPRDVIERLAPSLRSEDAAVRERAEKEVFALGDPGHRALEQMADGEDPVLTSMALRLLQRPEWRKTKRDERPLRSREIDEHVERTQKEIEERIEAMRRALQKQLAESLEGTEWVEPRDVRATRSGTIRRNGGVFTWQKDADGALRVTVKDGPDAEERRYSFESLDQAREQEPEIAKRLDEVLEDSPVIRFKFPDAWRRSLEDLDLPDGTDVDRVRRDLRDWMDPDTDQQAAPPRLGILFAEPSDVLRAQLDLPRGGMVITRVVEGTAAARLRLQVHDVLVELAGIEIGTKADIAKALNSVPEGERLTAVVLRKAKRVSLEGLR